MVILSIDDEGKTELPTASPIFSVMKLREILAYVSK